MGELWIGIMSLSALGFLGCMMPPPRSKPFPSAMLCVFQVDAADDLYSALDRHRPGDEVTITVVRADGMEKPKFLPLKVVLGE